MELAKNLKGHLLLVSGDQDRNVHPAHLLRMANALIQANKNFEMLLMRRISEFFEILDERLAHFLSLRRAVRSCKPIAFLKKNYGSILPNIYSETFRPNNLPTLMKHLK